MELYLKREELPTKTFGKLFKEQIYLNETLEDVVRPEGEYVKNQTAIPYGRYRVIISFSNRFQRQMPQIVNVRGSNITYHGISIDACGIRLHGGNVVDDTEGCVLNGKTRNANGIQDCASTVQAIIDLVKKTDETEEVYLN